MPRYSVGNVLNASKQVQLEEDMKTQKAAIELLKADHVAVKKLLRPRLLFCNKIGLSLSGHRPKCMLGEPSL